MSEFGMLIYALGVCLFGMTAVTRNIYWGRQSALWPKVDGEVFESFVRGVFIPYWPVVRYGYQYGGQQFQSSRIRFGRIRFPSKRTAQKFLSQFQSGARVVVRVNPSRPTLSVLREGNRFVNWGELIGGCLFTSYVVYRLYEIF